MKRKLGVTLVESMVALTVASGIVGASVKAYSEYSMESEVKSVLSNMNDLVKAVDGRLTIDGYDINNWGISPRVVDNRMEFSWNGTSAVSNDLVLKELTSTTNDCARGGWTPLILGEQNITLIPCGLFNNYSSKYDISAEIKTSENDSFVEFFDVYLRFDDVDDFADQYMDIKQHITKLSSEQRNGISGKHTMAFVNESDLDAVITTSECVSDLEGCVVRSRFDRDGGEAYIRIDGQSSIINDNFSFIDTNVSGTPLMCERWYLNGDGDWVNDTNAEDLVECGIGIYERSPLMVETHSSEGTFENIFLNRECDRVAYIPDNREVSISERVPCGITEDGVLISVVETSIATEAVFNELYSGSSTTSESNIERLNVENINQNGLYTNTRLEAVEIGVEDTLNVDFLNIEKGLEVDDLLYLKGTSFMKALEGDLRLEAGSIIYFNNKGSFDEVHGEELNVLTEIEEVDSLGIEELKLTSGELHIKNTEIEKSLSIKDTLYVKDMTMEVLNADFIKSDTLMDSIVDDMYLETVVADKISGNFGDFANLNAKINELKRKIELRGMNTLQYIPPPSPILIINNHYTKPGSSTRLSGCGPGPCVK